MVFGDLGFDDLGFGDMAFGDMEWNPAAPSSSRLPPAVFSKAAAVLLLVTAIYKL